jgi:lipoate-protein ligase B
MTMGAFYNIMLGYFFGFALGVGCALAVFYAIYSGGYRKAVEHSLLEQKPKDYLDAVAAAKRSSLSLQQIAGYQRFLLCIRARL